MRNSVFLMWVVVGATVLACTTVQAAKFDPLFRLTRVVKDCQIRTPDAGKYQAVEDQKIYPYGSIIKTGPDSEVTIVLSADNECRVYPNALVHVLKDPKDDTRRIFMLDTGKLEFELQEKFAEFNKLDLTTACATVSPQQGGQFVGHAQREGELTVIAVLCRKGAVEIRGPQFHVTKLESDEAASCACSADGVLTRLKNVKGQFDVAFVGEDGSPETVSTTPGEVVKIYRKPTDDRTQAAVTTLIVDSNGTLVRSVIGTVALPPPSSTATARVADDTMPVIEPAIIHPPSDQWTILDPSDEISVYVGRGPTTTTTIIALGLLIPPLPPVNIPPFTPVSAPPLPGTQPPPYK